MNMPEMLQKYEELLATKDRLADETKKNNEQLEQTKTEIIQEMIDQNCPITGTDNFAYSLAPKTKWNKRSEKDLLDAGVDFLQTLREEGLGELIVEKVDPRTLNSAISNLVDENDGNLPEGLEKIVSRYDYNDLSKTKMNPKKAAAIRAARATMEERE